jgi:hypothetical protein
MVDLLASDEIEVDEVTAGDDPSPYVEFEIATYPSDLTLSVIHEMWRDREITIPSFQRNFVWSIKQSSQLVESFLIGLPVPQVFFYIDSENKNLVIDGQQRIMSIVFFFEGYFGFENLQGRRTVFRLTGLSEKSPYVNKRFEDLEPSDQRRLRGSVLRAVNIRQLAPTNQSTSMFHIFERLNTGGTPLRAQEIRNCVFHGPIVQILNDLNENTNWRRILGKKTLDKYQRDVEMVLRVFAISERGSTYEKPMKEFLNQQMKLHARDSNGALGRFAEQFKEVTSVVIKRLGDKPFHVRGPLNLAALDSVLGVLVRQHEQIPPDLRDRFDRLLEDDKFKEAIYFNTSDNSTVKDRVGLATRYLFGP